MKLNLPRYTYSEVGRIANNFLKEHHPSLDIPIPVEDILDLKMGFHIFPFPRLFKDFGLNGFLSSDMSTIYVDEVQYDQYNEKYRYTLAHELGHYVLHKSVYENLPYKSPEEFVHWRLHVPPEEIGWFETHGNWFAGHLLVPTSCLEEVCRDIVLKYQDTFSEFDSIPDDIWSYISNEVATYFDVNPPVVEAQIRKESIIQKIPIRGKDLKP